MEAGFAERSAMIRRSAARLCWRLGWSCLHEVRLPSGRRADILALRPDGSFACIEVKSGVRDFVADRKWHEYRDHADALYFAVDPDFPIDLLPAGPGVIVADADHAEILRPAEAHRLAPARRRMLLHRFATLAADRLGAVDDPAGFAETRGVPRVE
jgi:hypothetical protein